MAGEINFGLSDPNAVYSGAAHTNALLKQFAQVRAGQALAKGDTQGAQNTLNDAGDIAGAQQVEANHWSQQAHIKALTDEQQAKSSAFVADASAALYKHYVDHKGDPDGGVGAVTQGFDQIAPLMKAKGASDQDIATYRQQLAQDPAGFLTLMHNEAASHLKRYTLGKDQQLVDDSGQTLASNQQPEYKIVKDGNGAEHLVAVGGQPDHAVGAATKAVPNTGAAKINPDDAFGAVVQQESGGRPGVTGPMTAHGQALGETQLLPATAEAMAKKLGVPFQPELLKGTTPEAEAYQQKLGRAYFDEGLQKYNGDIPSALAYYHGGPNENEWGPKTRAYVHNVLNRLQPYQVAANGQTPAPPQDGGPAPTGGVPVQELFSTQGAKWETRTAQQGDAHFRPGTTYEVNSATGQTRKLQDPINPNGKGGSGQKLSQSENAQLAKLRTQVNEVQNVAGLYDQFVTLNQKVNTGGSMALPGVGTVLSAVNPQVGRMKAITDQITPAMRNGLPGAASDRDVAMFRGATVGLDKPLQTNMAIRDAAKAFANRQGDYLAFLETYARQNGTLLGSGELWKDYVDKHPLFSPGGADGMLRVNKATPWRQAISLAGAPAAAPTTAAGRHRVYDPASGEFK